MKAELVHAKLGHALLVARHCREEERADLSQDGARRSLIDYLRRSSYARALLIDGRCVAVGGAIGSLLGSRAHVWGAVTPRAMQEKRALLMMALAGLVECQRCWPELEAVILVGDIPAMNFAGHLGFLPKGTRVMPDGVEVRDLVMLPAARRKAA